MGGPAVTYPSTAVSLPIEEAGEGGEESDDDVEAAEVWPLVGRVFSMFVCSVETVR